MPLLTLDEFFAGNSDEDAIAPNQEKLKTVEETTFDIACLDIEIPGMNGLELAKRMKDQCADINIIFVTVYSEYALQAHELYCSGYLLKSIRKSAVEKVDCDLNEYHGEYMIQYSWAEMTVGYLEKQKETKET